MAETLYNSPELSASDGGSNKGKWLLIVAVVVILLSAAGWLIFNWPEFSEPVPEPKEGEDPTVLTPEKEEELLSEMDPREQLSGELEQEIELINLYLEEDEQALNAYRGSGYELTAEEFETNQAEVLESIREATGLELTPGQPLTPEQEEIIIEDLIDRTWEY